MDCAVSEVAVVVHNEHKRPLVNYKGPLAEY